MNGLRMAGRIALTFIESKLTLLTFIAVLFFVVAYIWPAPIEE